MLIYAVLFRQSRRLLCASTVTKDTAKYLVKKWKALIDRAQGGGPKRAATPSAPPAASVSKKRVELAGTTSAGDEGEFIMLCIGGAASLTEKLIPGNKL